MVASGEKLFPETLGEYLTDFGSHLVSRLRESSRPLVEEGFRSADDLGLLREPYAPQWDRIEGVKAAWDHGQSVLLSGQTGTGKTLVAMVAALVHAKGKPFRCLVYCPAHLTKKWVREIKLTIPGAQASIIGKYSDLAAMRKWGPPQGPEYCILSDSKAKLGTSWEPAFVRREFTDGETGLLRCPECDHVIRVSAGSKATTVTVPAKEADLKKRQLCCENCKTQLYQWVKRFDRWPCADYINRHMKHWFRYFVLDECHVTKGKNSASGRSVGQLVSSIKYKLGMTGTILNGYADSLFPTLYRFNPARMRQLELKHRDSMEFARRYGRLETVTVYESVGSANRMSKGNQLRRSVRVKPGIVPDLYGDCLLGNSIFLQLEDLGFELPTQKHFLHSVPMDSEQARHYQDMEQALRSSLGAMLRSGSKAAMSILLNTLIGWPDYPLDFGEVGYMDEGNWVSVCEPPDLDLDVLRNKEQALVEIVKDAVQRGNQAWVYTVMTQKRDVQGGLQELLRREGIDCRVLRSHKVPTDQREEWIAKNGDADCMIMHPQLVSMGLDAFDAVNHKFNFNTLIFYSSGYVLDTVRQASGRARRIGQTKDCELHFMYYAETMQEHAAMLMSQKTKAAESIDGNFTDTGLASLAGNDENTAMLLVKTLMEGGVLAA